MLEPEDFGAMFERDPKRDRRILETLQPSDFVPAVGQFFRVRFATYADRSYIDCIWECKGNQNGCVLAHKVLGMSFSDGLKSFTVGDMLFYDCTEAWTQANAKPAPDGITETSAAAA